MTDPSLLGSLLRVAIVLVLLVGALRLVARKTGAKGGRTASPLFRRVGAGARLTEVVDRCAVSRNGSVAVVRVADRMLVLGVTDQRIDVLDTLEDIDAENDLFPHPDTDGSIDLAGGATDQRPIGRLKGFFGSALAVKVPGRSPRHTTGRRSVASQHATEARTSVSRTSASRTSAAASSAAKSHGPATSRRTPPPKGRPATAWTTASATASANSGVTDLRGEPGGGVRLADDRTIELATAALGRIEVAPHALGRVERAATAVAARPAFGEREITPATFPGLRRDLLGDAYDEDDDTDDLWITDDDPSAFADDDLVRVDDRAARRPVDPLTSPARMPGESPAPWKALVEEIRGRLDD